ncbi:hypothetical protein [uncultured Maritimibacter sp.]|uniref:hypothetical protein n=2 Tax=Maritimibacter TaxID=404235 RepID=UPI0030DD5983
MFRFVALVSIALMTAACKPVRETINEITNHGKLAGVANCIELSPQGLLSEEAVRGSCIAKFQTELPPWVAQSFDGRGGPSSLGKDKVFSGVITDSPDEYVITKFRVSVVTYASEGDEPDHASAVVEGWFEPGSQYVEFTSLPLDDLPKSWGEIDGMAGCDGEEKRDCWTWTIVGTWGLAL